LLITGDTYRFVSQIFECIQLESVMVKGLSEPVSLYRVDGLRTEPGMVRGIHGLESPMVGREDELAELEHLCEAVRFGLGRMVIIRGEPGIGKTRLISEWKAVVDSERPVSSPVWVEGRGFSYRQTSAYHLCINLLRSLLNISDTCEEDQAKSILLDYTHRLFEEDFMEVYPYLGDLLSIELDGEAKQLVRLPDPQTLQTQYLRAVRRLFLAVASQQPLILVIEDLHWADPSSVDLLIRLLPSIIAEPVLVCLVTRDERETPGWRLVNAARESMGESLIEISLPPLSDDDSQKMVAHLLEIESLPEQVRKVILKKSEGNPFFVEEIIRMLIDRGAIIQENGSWSAGTTIDKVVIPDNLQGLLLARIDRLPEDQKLVLRVASVIGRKFPVQVLEQVIQERII
jgi:predicted ATPase